MAGQYQSVDELRKRLGKSYQPKHFYDHNKEKRFDELLEELEEAARGIIENHHDDQTFAYQEDRVDELRATDDSAVRLVYPIQDVSTVEIKLTTGSEWREYDADRWDSTDHSLVLQRRRSRGGRRGNRRNDLLDHTKRATWSDIAEQLRVTYDRGFDPIPPDVIDVQTELVIRMLRNRRMEQNIASVDPENIRQVSESLVSLSDEQRRRIDSITGFGGHTMSV